MIAVNRRRYMGNTGFTQIEYLQSSGTQYINTGIKPSIDTRFLYRIEVMWSASNHRQLMGAQNINFFGVDFSLKYDSYNTMTQTGSTSSFDTVEFVMVKLNNKTYRRFTYINETLSTTAWESNSLFSSNDICIFGLLTTDGGEFDSRYACNCKIKSFKIYNDQTDTVYLDLIPVRVGQTGYMYDKVSKKLLGNSGTGNFILGNDV